MHQEAGTAVAEVVTGEAVVLDVPCARFPSRLVALVLDLLIQGILLFVLFLIVGLAVTNDGANAATAGAIALTVTIAIIVGYPVLWETLTRGGTPGKFALGLRVVSDDGGPERFRQPWRAGSLPWWKSGSCWAARPSSARCSRNGGSGSGTCSPARS
jgi:uncharacterized RDD family membrane protein YckC